MIFFPVKSEIYFYLNHDIVYPIYKNLLLTLITVSIIYFIKHQTTTLPTQQVAFWVYGSVIKYRLKGSCGWGLSAWLGGMET